MLNKALRTQEIEMIIRMGFVVRHLHQQIDQLYYQQKHPQSFIVYRGQGMIQSEFDKINNSKGGLLAFHSFLSTSDNLQVSLNFARDALRINLIAILFQIEIDLAQSITPFASLDDTSYFKDREKEILFSMHTVFRIEETKQIEPRFFQINLTLTKDNDKQLTELAECIKNVTRGQKRIHRLGSLMIAMAEFKKAKKIFTTLIDTTSKHDREGHAFFHYQLGVINWEQRDLACALFQFQRSLDISLTYLSSDNPQLFRIYSSIGTILQEQGHSDNSLKHLTLALNIDLQALQSDQLNSDPHALQVHQIKIADRHNNIGLFFENQGMYDEAFLSYERALRIELVHLPRLHSLLATTYNNIGMVHLKTGNSFNALSCYEKTLEIFERSLPSNHPSLAIVCYNMACALADLNRTQEAIERTEKAVKIVCYTRGPDDPQVKQYKQYLDKLRLKL
jgi:tetratricopeptide (TPR) repeat protein